MKAPARLLVRYFAILRDQSGLAEETVDSKAETARELYAELMARHGFSLEADYMKVAINAEFADWESPLSSGDTVVFIPPTAGG